MEAESKQTTRAQRFVNSVISLCQSDKGAAASLRKGTNPLTEYQSWEYLVRFGVDLDKEWERLAFGFVASSLAQHKITEDGQMGLGAAIAGAYPDGNASEPAKTRLRRILACDDLGEACQILRPVIALTESRNNGSLSYITLLGQLVNFNRDPQRIKTRWAQDFYRTGPSAEVAS